MYYFPITYILLHLKIKKLKSNLFPAKLFYFLIFFFFRYIEKDSNKIDDIMNRAKELASNLVSDNNDISSKNVPINFPDTNYELLRHRLNTDVREFWFYISVQLNKLKQIAKNNSPALSDKLDEFLKMAVQHKL